MDRELRLENADSTRPLSSAVRSMSKWFQTELGEIVRAIDYGERHLAAHPEDTVTRDSVEELRRKRDDLCDGWERSTLRRAVGLSSAGPAADGRERRVGLADAPPVGSPARATSASSSNTTAKAIFGYAAIFGQETVIAGIFRETIQAGAFTEALANSDIRCLYNHDHNCLLGRTSAGTLELKQDGKGLFFRACLLPFDPMSYGIARRVDRRDVQGNSFSFSDVKDRWQFARKPGELDLRIIEKIGSLYDVGPVTFPAYESTSVSAVFEKVDSGRALAPAHDEEELDVDVTRRPRPGGRPISAWQHKVLELTAQSIRGAIDDWDVAHVEDRFDDIARRVAIDQARREHLAAHPGDGRRLDVVGGLLYAGRG